MAIGTSNIKMSDINAEVSSVDSTQLRALSTNAITTGNTIDGTAPHRMNEFAGYVHTNLADFPSTATWSTFNHGSTSAGSYTQVEAFASIAFQNDTSNAASPRIIITYYGGTSNSYATVYTQYMSYSGYSGAISVKYAANTALTNAGNSTSYPPKGTPDNSANNTSGSTDSSSYRKVAGTNYTIPTSGSTQFKWFVRTNGARNSNTQVSAAQNGVIFTISFTSDGELYSKSSSSHAINIAGVKGFIF